MCSEYEQVINPFDLLKSDVIVKHKPNPKNERQINHMKHFFKARDEGYLHTFTCKTIDPSVINGHITYTMRSMPAIGHSQKWWEQKLKLYDPTRNSRQMTYTEYLCRNLFIIWRLVEEEGWSSDSAWYTICNDSQDIANYHPIGGNVRMEYTGSKGVAGFYDLANTWKLLAEDPWDCHGGFFVSGGDCRTFGDEDPTAQCEYCNYDYGYGTLGVGMLSLD